MVLPCASRGAGAWWARRLLVCSWRGPLAPVTLTVRPLLAAPLVELHPPPPRFARPHESGEPETGTCISARLTPGGSRLGTCISARFTPGGSRSRERHLLGRTLGGAPAPFRAGRSGLGAWTVRPRRLTPGGVPGARRCRIAGVGALPRRPSSRFRARQRTVSTGAPITPQPGCVRAVLEAPGCKVLGRSR